MTVWKRWLIDEWKSAHKLWSIRISALSAAIMASWTYLPADLRDNLPYANQLAAGLFLSTLIARLMVQADGQ
jgi:hypothetical protein